VMDSINQVCHALMDGVSVRSPLTSGLRKTRIYISKQFRSGIWDDDHAAIPHPSPTQAAGLTEATLHIRVQCKPSQFSLSIDYRNFGSGIPWLNHCCLSPPVP